MERVLYSSSPNPLKTHLRHSPFLPRFDHINSANLNFFSSTRPLLKGFNLFSCKYEGQPVSSSPSLLAPSNDLSSLPGSGAGSSNGSALKPHFPLKPHFLKYIANWSTDGPKVTSAGKCMVLSPLILILIQTIFAPAAFATFQTAAKTGHKLIRTELLTSAWTGFFAGCLHTLSGPDHLAALAPLSIGRTRLESAAVGALWGCGHDAGQVIFGLIFLLLKDRLHIEVIRTWGTRVVGFTLLIIGALGIREASEVPTPCVALENGECDVSNYETLEKPTNGKKKKIGFATFATGIIHGLQPDALMMVLPALALPSRVAGAAFLVMFLVGTVFAMGSYTVFIGSCSQALKDRIPRITEKLTWAASFVAITLGIAILISQLFGYSLY